MARNQSWILYLYVFFNNQQYLRFSPRRHGLWDLRQRIWRVLHPNRPVRGLHRRQQHLLRGGRQRGLPLLLQGVQGLGRHLSDQVKLLVLVSITFSLVLFRLGFDLFSISQPQTEVSAANTNPNARTQCQRATFTANSDGPSPPTICGTNTGYHMILEVFFQKF